MTLQIAFALYPLILAGAALVWMLRGGPRSRSHWLMKVAVAGSVVAFVFLTGPWAFTSYYLRYALLGIFVLAVVYSYYRHTGLSDAVPTGWTAGRLALYAPALLLFTALSVSAITAHIGHDESLSLSFPLVAGTYYVLQGGNSVVTNTFHTLSGSKHALDIVKLNTFGNRARGIAPRSLDDYEIFGETLHSPCGGTVVTVRSALPDNAPGKTDAEHHEGNYIIVRCGDVDVFMAHLRQSSIRVAPGDVVRPGQPLAEVGNSGNTLEPHLHIDARKRGEEIGLVFNGRRLSVNSVVIGAQRDAQPVAAGRP